MQHAVKMKNRIKSQEQKNQMKSIKKVENGGFHSAVLTLFLMLTYFSVAPAWGFQLNQS